MRKKAAGEPDTPLKIYRSRQLQRGGICAYLSAPPHANWGGCRRDPLRFSARPSAVVGRISILKTTRE